MGRVRLMILGCAPLGIKPLGTQPSVGGVVVAVVKKLLLLMGVL